MTNNELRVLAYLSQEDEIAKLGTFIIRCIRAKRENKAACEKHRISRPGEFTMTPQEELFAELFNHERKFYAEIPTPLERQAHREQLSRIAYEAKARLAAISEIDREDAAKGKKANGFAKSVNEDNTGSLAINAIKENRKKLSKNEKMREDMIKKLGIDPKDVDQIMSAQGLLKHMKGKEVITPASATGGVFKNSPEQQALIDSVDKQETLEQQLMQAAIKEAARKKAEEVKANEPKPELGGLFKGLK